MDFEKLLIKLNACSSAIEFARDMTIEEAWAKCERGDWMLWLYQKLHPDNIREITLAKGHCANTVRHLLKDERSIKAIDAAIAYGEGRISIQELKIAAYAAAAAYAAVNAAVNAAAYATVNAVAAAAYAAYAAVNAAADAAAYAAYATAAAAYTPTTVIARNNNQKLTANICRKYLQCPKIN